MCQGDADAMIYRSRKLPLVILAEMKHHFCGGPGILKGDVQPIEREELNPYRLKLPLLHRHSGGFETRDTDRKR